MVRIPLRVIIVEDSEEDTKALLRELQRGGYDPVHVRVDGPAAMEETLARAKWDLVIADSGAPSFGAMGALRLLQREALDLPFVVVSGGRGGEVRVEGRENEILGRTEDDHPSPLNAAVALELRETRARRARRRSHGQPPGQKEELYRASMERKETEEALKQSEERFRLLADGVRDYALVMLDPEGRVATWNKGAERIKGYEAAEVLGEHLSRFYEEKDVLDAKPERDLRGAAEEGRYEEEGVRVRKDGSRFTANVVITALRDASGALRGFSQVTHDITERKQTEKELHNSLEALLAVYEAGHILGSTLEAEEVGSRLLQLMQRISSSATAVISVPDEQERLRVWRAIGFENLWRRARYTPEVQQMLHSVMLTGRHEIATLEPPDPNTEFLVGLFLPLRLRNRTVGVLEVYGPDAMTQKDVIDILLNLTTKAASALENARLYGELAERERQLQELVGKLMWTQEEERRRVAYEVHDGPTQVAVAAYQHLQAYARNHPPGTPEDREALEQVVELARRTVGESRQIIANLRPTALDDFGLPTALRLQVEALRAEGWQASFEQALDARRVSEPLETALYRVGQEALTNVRKHARTTRVRVKLGTAGGRVRLRIRDWGRGFGPDDSADSGPGEQVGLASMRERIALVGGELRVYSREGVGTLVTADVPLREEAGPGGLGLGRGLHQLMSINGSPGGGHDG